MGKAKSKDNINSLLAAIQRKAPGESPSEAPIPNVNPAPETVTPGRPKSRVGRPVQFWLHDEDRHLVRELAAWLSGQGLRPTDSMVIRAALRTAKAGDDLLKAYQEASRLDGRLKQQK
jgi:hypothetical protein